MCESHPIVVERKPLSSLFLSTVANRCRGRWPCRAIAAIIVAVGFLWSVAARGESPTALVNDLGSADPAVRSAAARSLAALGGEARAAILQGLKSSDAEIRRRCRWLIEEIEWTDLRRRRALFVQAADPADGCGLPGWQRFHRIAGAAPNARELFAAMIDAEPALMMAIEANNAEAIAGRLVSGVSLKMQGYWIDDEPSIVPEPSRTAAFWYGFITLADLTAKKSLKIDSPSESIAAAAPADAEPESFFYQLSDSLLEEDSLDAAMTHKQFGPATQRLIGAYLEGIKYDGETAFLADRFLDLALRYRLPEGLPLSASVLRNNDSSGESRAMAIVHLAIVGGKPYASLIEKQLTSATSVLQSEERTRCEVRDVALVWLIYLTGQGHEDYSLNGAGAYCEAWVKMRPADFDGLQVGIAITEAQRRAARKKWAEYVAKHPLPEMPESIRKRLMPEAGPSGGTDAEAAPGRDVSAEPPPATENDSDENTQPADERPPDPRWTIAQRESVRLLAEADDLVAHRQYAAAARLADELLSLPPSYYAPGRGRPLWCELHRSVERAVLRWPTAAQVAYVQRTAPEAADELTHAVRRGRADEIAAVAHRWLHTPAGAEAAWLLAHRDLDRGDWLRGLLRLEQLKSTSISAWRLEPGLTLRIVQCQLNLGMRREAEAILRSAAGLLDRSAALATAWAAEPPRTLDELCRRLENTRPTDDGAAPLTIESLKFLSSRLMPWLREQPQPISEPPAPLAALINDRQRRLAARNRPTVPIAHPLFVNNLLLHRTPTHLEAIEWPGGRVRWRQPLEDRLQHYQRLFADSPAWTYKKGIAGLLWSMVSDQSAKPVEVNRKILLERIEERLWRDGRFSTLSSDGRRVFGVENDAHPMPHDYQRFAAAANGRRFIEGTLPTGNLLAAYDLATGKLLWEVGSANALSGDYGDYINLPAGDNSEANTAAAPRKRATGDPFGPPRPWAGREGSRRQVFFERPDWSIFCDLQFLGPPLPLAGRLYVAASSAEATYLLELAPEDGRLHWALMLEAKPLLESHFEAVYLLAVRCAMAAVRAPGGCVQAEGVLVCHDGEKFFGVDLAQRRTVWAYPLAELEASAEGEDATDPFEQAMQNDRSSRFDFVWVDPPALAVGPYVLLAPSHQKTIDCLRAADGRLCWSMPRREGLYFGAITADRVVIVERGGVRCLALDDGRLLWRQAFPQGATPVGRGYQLAGRLLVPLRDVGVPAFDLDTGRIIGWQRPEPQIRLGNLIPAGDNVLLHTAVGLFRCDDAFRAAEVAQRNAPPADADAPTRQRHVELLLAAGEARRALVSLRELPDNARREEPLRRLTLTAAIDAVRSEPAATLETAAAVLSEAMEHSPEEAQPLAVAMADGYEQIGRRGEAFRLLFVAARAEKDRKSLSLKSRFDRLERVEAARQVAFDRLVSLRLEELYRAAERAEQAQIDRCLIDAMAVGQSREAALRLAPWHPAAAEVFVEQARAARQSGRLHEAEWLLAAAARLTTERTTELETERRTVQREGAPMPIVWPEKFLEIDPGTKRDRAEGGANESAAEPVDAEDFPFGTQQFLELQPAEPGDGVSPIRISVDQPMSSLLLVDAAGRRFATCPIGNAGAFGVFGEFAAFDGYGLPEWHGYYLGRLAIVSSGLQVEAFDLLRPGNKPLWSLTAETAEVLATQAAHGFFNRELSAPGQRTRMPAVSRSAVCAQLGQRLMGIEPHTGRILWQRDDLPYGCDLFGDDEVLFATPPSGENTFVCNPRDGRERQVIDPIDRSERFTVIGRNVVYWRVEGRGRTLVCVDPLSGKTRWKHRFGERAHIVEVDPLRAAVLDLDGAITIVSMTSGRVECTLRVEPLDKIESFMVLHGMHGYDVLISKAPLSEQSSFGHWRYAFRFEGVFCCGFGQLYHFDPQGRRIWHVPLKSSFVFRHHPVDAPVFVLVEVREGRFLNLTRQETRVTCFDRRDGSVLFEKAAKKVESVDTSVITAADGSKIEVRSPLGTVRFRAAKNERPTQ